MPRVVIISAFHDYRTAKRASIHQVAKGLVRSGLEVSFVSTRFSWLSKWKGDSRLFLWDKANRVEEVDGVACLLWRTAFHPFHSRSRLMESFNRRLYPGYSELPNRDFDRLVEQADYVVIESSAAVIYLRRVRRLNSRAKIIYYAADRLRTIGAHPFLERRLLEDSSLIDHVILRAEAMKEDFGWAAGRVFRTHCGFDEADFAAVGPSPYPPGSQTAVSVGSMLFDPSVFQLAAPAFPDVQFHVIGCGADFERPRNVHLHAEMPFNQTLAFVKHASVGIAPYVPADGADYLAESSLKLAQFEYLGLPAICPYFATGSSPARFGYQPGDSASIEDAIRRAMLQSGKVLPRRFPSWRQVALQVIEPEQQHADRVD